MNKRLELALRHLDPGNWERFEKFASEFLSSEFPSLRTMASPSGDEGWDAELFAPVNEATQVLQYSVQKDWKAKIRATAKRLKETIPTVQLLIYVTNQQIGAEADDLRSELRTDHGLFLDVRDLNYFVERHRRSTQTETAAESLAKDIVDPWLASQGVTRHAPVLETDEAKAAHVYLSLQLRDEVREKGLTKLSVDALVRSVLLKTNAEQRMSRSELKNRMRSLLRADVPSHVDQLTDSALSRLTKKSIRHYPPKDEFCLTFYESQRVQEYIARQELSEATLSQEIDGIVMKLSPPEVQDTERISRRVRRILERCLYERAEAFASAVLSEDLSNFQTDDLRRLILEDLKSDPFQKGHPASDPAWMEVAIRQTLTSSSEAIRSHLRDLADAYTLFSFLRHTPDVQSAVQKMFSHGEIWLDTSAILPLIAEELLDDGVGRFQEMFRTAAQAGLQFFATSGVIEELDRHISNCITCSQMTSRWEGPFPFLFEAYLQSGRSLSEFENWTSQFRGDARPVDDLIDYLDEQFGIKHRDLESKANEAAEELRNAVREVWYEIHNKRRSKSGTAADLITLNRLSKHDAENYLGVIQLRRQETSSALGYSAWWLTFDRTAHSVGSRVKQQFRVDSPVSPVMSPDFLAQYLTLSPARARLSENDVKSLPISVEPHLVRFLTRELLDEAAQIRTEMKDLPDRVVRRRVRDHLDQARQRMGPVSEKGIDAFFDELEQ